MNDVDVTDFDSFEFEYIPKEIKKFIRDKNVITNIYRIEANDSIMCGCLCNGIIDFFSKCLKFAQLYQFFSSSEYEKNDKLILKYFQ